MPLDPLALQYSLFRVGVVAFSLVACAWLWRRPRPLGALVLVLALNLAGWAAYILPLARLYGLQEHTDRGFNVGMAAVAAAGNSPFEHTQRGFANLEPLWSAALAALAFYRPENVMAVFFWLSPATIVLVALGLYRGLRVSPGEDDAWERVLVVFATLGLSSFSLSQGPPIPALWAANFLYKPNHVMGWALVGVAIGMAAREAPPWRLGLVLGLLSWVFLLHWAFLLPGLAVGTWLRPRAERRFGALAGAVLVSLLIVTPYVVHLMKDYSPTAKGESPAQMWQDALGPRLFPPHWATLDLGALLLSGVAGAIVLAKRRAPRDMQVLGVLAGSWLLWLGYEVASPFGVAPEPDEHHYFLRLAMALSAGSALAALGRHLERTFDLARGRGAVLALAAAIPLSFVAYWDPPRMDRYFRFDRIAIGPKVHDYTRWVRENTPKDAVFAAGPHACMWIPIYSGRRVLLVGGSRPPTDYAARREAERILLLSGESDLIRATAKRFGVDYLAIDQGTLAEYGEEAFEGIARLPAYELVYQSSAVRILKIKK